MMVMERTRTARQAAAIPPVAREEVLDLAGTEVQRVIDQLNLLAGDDWSQPTDCTEWDVRDMVAHLAGAAAGGANFWEFLRQSAFNPHMRGAPIPIDAINKKQLEDRADRTPAELVAEFREVGPQAAAARFRLPGLLRRFKIDALPMPGKMTVGYLMDVIYSRDQWMHRMDIHRATGKPMVTTPEHDGRLLDLVMLDVATTLGGRVDVIVNVTGLVAASYRFGDGEPVAEIDIDFLTFNRRASMRLDADTTMEAIRVQGETAVARAFIEGCPVLY